MNALTTRNLSAGYQTNKVLKNISLDLPRSQATAIIGPNGAGKSTLLKGLMNLLPHVSGEVDFFGEPLKKQYHNIAYVPQREEVDWDFPICVLDVVLMGRHGQLKFWQRPNKQDQILAQQSLEKVGMQAFAQRQISQLSGGQQQRVFIARALTQQAKLYLMDEPFAGVDMATEKAIVALFRQLKANKQTIICVHHDLNTLQDYFDWVIMINAGLVAYGPIKEVLTLDNLNRTYDGRLPILQNLGLATPKGSN
ncbi:metal ABC transporter ATP-binding protein [Thiomicrospira pelophila]|uniref:metal ABC transporter ATP-binding protein n=1 Tax=Thiomicrospira pelophila TaxID=934 RepID=UPI0004A764DA|nr:metal ABC transporter ATP-binding protein [Thiomicrospira pelophila]